MATQPEAMPGRARARSSAPSSVSPPLAAAAAAGAPTSVKVACAWRSTAVASHASKASGVASLTGLYTTARLPAAAQK